jgi:mannosyltransferase
LFVAEGVWMVCDQVRQIPGRRGVVAVSIGLGMVACLGTVPAYIDLRTPFAKDGGADFRQVAVRLSVDARSGDTVLFGNPHRPSRSPRLAARLYPHAFAGLREPQLVTDYWRTNGLWDRLAPVGRVAPRLHGTVWLLEWGNHGTARADVTSLQRYGFTEISRVTVHRTTIHEFRKQS